MIGMSIAVSLIKTNKQLNTSDINIFSLIEKQIEINVNKANVISGKIKVDCAMNTG